MSDYKHLLPEERDVVLWPDKERIAYLNEPLWINYPRALNLLKILNEIMHYPKQPRMRNLLIIGEAHMGKTSIVMKFAQMHPDIVLEDEDGISKAIKPVIVATTPASNEEKQLYISILEQFWGAYNPSDSTAKLRHQVLHRMKECEVQMLILDDIHNIMESSTSKLRRMMDVIRNLGTVLMIPIVGVGTERAARVVSSDPQHASRFDLVRLNKWELDGNFQGLLKAFEKKLPLKKSSMLYANDKATHLHFLSDGNLGNLHRILVECAKKAIIQGDETIDIKIIKEAKWLKPTGKNMSIEIPI